MKLIKKINIVVFAAIVCFGIDANASIDISGIAEDHNPVIYYEGVPSPSNGTADFSVMNEFTNAMTVTDVTIQSVSAIYASNSAGWTCVYNETSSAPHIEGETICVPDSTLEIAPATRIDDILNVTFTYENLAGTANGPNALSLRAVIRGTSFETGTAVLGSNEWELTVTEDAPVDPTPTQDPAKVRGYIYFDDNNNDKRDKNEQGVEGVKIKLQYAGPNAKFDTGDDERYTDKTNDQGKYRFDDLEPGKYRLKIEDGQMIEFYLTSEKDTLNGKSNFSLDEGDTKERDFGYNRDRDSDGNLRNSNLSYLQSGFTFSIKNIINYLINLIK